MRASALVLRDMMALREVETRQKARQQNMPGQVHYLSLEFLMGRSLMKNAYNLGLLPQLQGGAWSTLGFKAADIFEIEPDAALGNGGLGRLAACYLDCHDQRWNIPATGYSICYELGIFKQQDCGGPAGGAARQLERPGRRPGCCPSPRRPRRFISAARVREFWENGHLHIVN